MHYIILLGCWLCFPVPWGSVSSSWYSLRVEWLRAGQLHLKNSTHQLFSRVHKPNWDALILLVTSGPGKKNSYACERPCRVATVMIEQGTLLHSTKPCYENNSYWNWTKFFHRSYEYRLSRAKRYILKALRLIPRWSQVSNSTEWSQVIMLHSKNHALSDSCFLLLLSFWALHHW